ncbi:hypothetical protein OAF98_01150 [Planctomicrobium sp.]|jgi:hypothetical protein|nr:hypothetical protein [Planctomicrobium sp.]MBT5019464.1 hypothetical protein [Planctomicrobium sp.]MDA7527381.1 hypothetical protein [bacterium]MDB4733525.1 hypothetical protein [Planctomicrobium sp.]MDB4743067.1 hypothetical protein [Planctomicrobium sp.]
MNETVETNLKSNRGRWTVVAMFGFAALMVSLLFIYWELYTAPFRPLQYAIADAFPESSPRVIGGQHKSHKTEHPPTLRVVIYVPVQEFDPETETEKSETRALKLARLAFEHQDVSEYELIQFVLLQKIPESARRRWTVMKTVDEWKELL